MSHYFERGYDRIDPSSLQLTATARPFAWSQLRELRSMTPDQAYVLEEARAAGLRTGVSVPLHGPYGTLGAVALASSAIVDVSQQHLDHLNSLAAQLHAAHSALTEPSAPLMPPVKLTPRERECLLWCARGKSNWEIGMILKISENSVKFHLKNAMSRLNSTSRILSVVKAIRLGLILP